MKNRELELRVFMDVGAHYGETLDVALDPGWGFDRLYSFEPAAACRRVLEQYRAKRLVVVPRGLSNRSATAVLYGAGLLGGSVYPDKQQKADDLEEQVVELERASQWVLNHTTPGDEIYLKLNCEGSECDVLDDLLDSGLIARVKSVYVDFDVSKIPTQAYRQALVERRLREAGVDFATPETLGSDTNAGVRAWLQASCPRGSGASVWYRLGLFRPPSVWVRVAAGAVLPRPAFYWLGKHLGTKRRAELGRRRKRSA